MSSQKLFQDKFWTFINTIDFFFYEKNKHMDANIRTNKKVEKKNVYKIK